MVMLTDGRAGAGCEDTEEMDWSQENGLNHNLMA